MEFSLFLSTFALIFVAELPDKTALAALFLATSHNPLAVFLGAAAAFVIQSTVAIACGSLFTLLPPHFVHLAAGIMFCVYAVLMWRRKAPETAAADCPSQGKMLRFSKSMATAFMTIFIAEWGDLTQLATVTLVAKYHSPGMIFVAATLALWAVTAIGVMIGSQVKHRIKPQLLQQIAASAFAVVGIGMLVRV